MPRSIGIVVFVLCLTSLVLTTQDCGTGAASSSCGCTPDRPASDDFRHTEKHVQLPSTSAEEVTVSDIIAWPTIPVTNSSPRTGNELQLFHISSAFVQAVWLYQGDCDIHLEISQTMLKSAPRVVVETPYDPEYCTVRQQTVSVILAHGVPFIPGVLQEVTPPLPAEVLGLAFQDFEHNRGTKFIATTWELHPAVVTIH